MWYSSRPRLFQLEEGQWPVEWSSGPRWVSNSLNQTGHCAELLPCCRPSSNLGLSPLSASSHSLLTLLCLSNPPSPPPPPLLLPVFPEKQQEANEAWRVFIQPSFLPLSIMCKGFFFFTSCCDWVKIINKNWLY